MKVVLVLILLAVAGSVCACGGLAWFGKNAVEKVGDDLEKEYQADRQDEEYVKNKKADMTVRQFDTAKPDEPKVVRAKIEMGSYWNYAYAGKEKTYHSFQIWGGIGGSEYVWIPKDAPNAENLNALCKDGNNHWVTLRIHRVGPDKKPTPSNVQGVLILDVIENK